MTVAAVLAVCVGLAVPTGPARADWPTVRVVVSGDNTTGLPYGAAIRTWGPTNDVFFLVDRFFGASNNPNGNQMRFFWSTCTGIACTGTPGGGRSLDPEFIRQDAGSDRAQSIFFGKPAISVDRTHLLLHVALVDADDYNNNNSDFATALDSTVYWYTKPYTTCP